MKRSYILGLGTAAALAIAAVALPVAAQQFRMPQGGAGMHGGYAQFMGNMQGGMMGTQHADMLAKYDTDGNGVLSAEEMTAAHAAEIATYDTDANGTLSLEEFQAMHAAHEQAQMEAMLAARFAALDADGDGQVSDAEMTAAAGQMGAGPMGAGGPGFMHQGQGFMRGMMGWH
jgi:hypothetical protein